MLTRRNFLALPLGRPDASTLQRETELLRGNESGHAAAEGRQHVQGRREAIAMKYWRCLAGGSGAKPHLGCGLRPEAETQAGAARKRGGGTLGTQVLGTCGWYLVPISAPGTGRRPIITRGLARRCSEWGEAPALFWPWLRMGAGKGWRLDGRQNKATGA
jgi:hypothetical protein